MDGNLTDGDRSLIEWLLPANTPFYRKMYEHLSTLSISSQHDDGAIVLGVYDEALSETVAIGEVRTDAGIQTISVSMTDDYTGFRLNFPHENVIERRWTLSGWRSGETSSQSNPVREIPLVREGNIAYLLALSPVERVVWLHHVGNGYNQLFPVTGIFVELARLRGKHEIDRLTSEAFFRMTEQASDREITEALLNYNKRAKKFDAEGIRADEETRRGIRGFFDRIRR